MENLRNSMGNFVDSKTSQQPFLQVDASVALTPNQNIVRVVGNSAAATVTLPPVGVCAGRMFAITAEDATASDVTVTDSGDSKEWTNIVLGTDGDGALLFCDGQKFWPLVAQ